MSDPPTQPLPSGNELDTASDEQLRTLMQLHHQSFGPMASITPLMRPHIINKLRRIMLGIPRRFPAWQTPVHLKREDLDGISDEKIRSLLILQDGIDADDLPDKLGNAWKDVLFERISNSNYCKGIGCNDIGLGTEGECKNQLCCFWKRGNGTGETAKCVRKIMKPPNSFVSPPAPAPSRPNSLGGTGRRRNKKSKRKTIKRRRKMSKKRKNKKNTKQRRRRKTRK